jgi:hypothetical protein
VSAQARRAARRAEAAAQAREVTAQPSSAETAAERARCADMTRTPRGWEQCHLDEHPPGVRHHVRDRSWSTGGKTPRLQLGRPCGPDCRWPDQVVAYFGMVPHADGGPKVSRYRKAG